MKTSSSSSRDSASLGGRLNCFQAPLEEPLLQFISSCLGILDSLLVGRRLQDGGLCFVESEPLAPEFVFQTCTRSAPP